MTRLTLGDEIQRNVDRSLDESDLRLLRIIQIDGFAHPSNDFIGAASSS
jgi:hypothetical protein